MASDLRAVVASGTRASIATPARERHPRPHAKSRPMSEHAPPSIVVVAGPSASGKSALALALAETFDGTVINADSMQVYRDLRVLTARPTSADEARAPHRLYGVIDAAEPCSAGRWRTMALAEVA